ncbi:aminotransferase class I/II-fold pyridoxal phosphate-dependent enzyme [Vibrio ponticus]|uniref:Aminotransferase n=1 Tax=Vibrio ponticus TaxID=265668 RepID=A0A3N3DV97_9VIBR|nr:threonine-phosphate decarboxylase [Vibrio ponticus]ROV58350.1 aminotransferase class I/II-fold pyridoxal phosphate-dependent enzyme [Vibrio ponticus]
MLHHGGRLIQEAQQRNSDPQQWLDLSTGISPISYPVPEIPTSVWHRLPEDEDGLVEAAAQYYQYPDLLPVAGSQAAIMCLPSVLEVDLLKKGTMLLPAVGYKEHEHAWQSAGWRLEYYQNKPDNDQLSRCDVVLIINPNNPTTYKYSLKEITVIEGQLSARQVLLIDEAFMDGDNDNSRLRTLLRENTLVLRSLGKFFGLAGLRVGFVAAHPKWLSSMQQALGPWNLSGPSRYVAKTALLDTTWQRKAQKALESLRLKQQRLIERVLPQASITSASLFIRVEHPQAQLMYQYCCDEMVLVRLCDEKDAIRLGLCADEQQLQRLELALIEAQRRINTDCSYDASNDLAGTSWNI